MASFADQAAGALRALALDETAKEKFCNDPLLRPYMHKVSQRYVAGQTVEEALQRVGQIIARGHAASAEYMGESVRDEAFAMAETEVFMQLVKAIGQRNLNCSISFDLSHVGSLVDSELGYRNARRIALAAAEINREVMISMEGIDRADDIYAIYTRLHKKTTCATSASPCRPSAIAPRRTCRR
jgi:proline dehydrogenase